MGDVGAYIQRGTEIEYDIDRPLCEKCFESWRRYAKPEYKELLCHDCGNERATSYAKPLCRTCFTALT